MNFINIKNNKNNKNKGFTLIELLVSICLFTIVLTIAFTALYSIMDANKKTKTVKSVVNNLNMAMESMTREIRVGYRYTCNSTTPATPGQDCVSPAPLFSFKTKDGQNAFFRYNDTEKIIERKIDGKENTPVTLTATDVIIDNLSFYVKGTASGDDLQPRVLILMKGHVEREGVNSEFNIQSTISQRKLAP
ncbi:MAG: prepilin-type N-terminal cleavage/methylation domain-containing protein [Candidatus Pacebacteria bacterium]|nr:prepilin-type N-terminal cleavage/methylation domain-containing protein [Candidatus Paceibacterota bacterium]